MAGAHLLVRASSVERALAPHRQRLGDLTPAMRRTVGLIRESVGKEFVDRVWFMPQGGSKPWAPVVSFGSLVGEDASLGAGLGGRKALIRTGKYYDAWQGRGEGAIEQVTARQVVVGVSSARFPYAEYIRGGTGAAISLTPLVIRPKRFVSGRGRGVMASKMRFYLGFTYGVWARRETLLRGFRLPRRPHGTTNPALRDRIARTLERYIVAGKVG